MWTTIINFLVLDILNKNSFLNEYNDLLQDSLSTDVSATTLKDDPLFSEGIVDNTDVGATSSTLSPQSDILYGDGLKLKNEVSTDAVQTFLQRELELKVPHSALKTAPSYNFLPGSNITVNSLPAAPPQIQQKTSQLQLVLQQQDNVLPVLQNQTSLNLQQQSTATSTPQPVQTIQLNQLLKQLQDNNRSL